MSHTMIAVSHLITRKSLLIISTVLSGVLIWQSTMLAHAQAVSFNGKRDCDNNAVIYCGAMTTHELIDKYHRDPSARVVYSHFGIQPADINALVHTAQAGSVTKDGRILIGDRLVAGYAATAGRQNIRGSKLINKDGVQFYTRPPHVSFRNESLDAYVVMHNNQFKFAIIAACGNPVGGFAVPTPPPAPAPQPVKPAAAPAPKPSAPVPTPPPAPAPAPAALPKTGAASLAGAVVATTGLGIAGHQVVLRRRRRLG